MMFLQYLKDKRYFFLLYFAIMFFVSLMMMVSINDGNIVKNLIYINIVCFCLAGTYIIVGYFHRNSFYRQITEIITNGKEEMIAAIPEPQNYTQAMYLDLLK